LIAARAGTIVTGTVFNVTSELAITSAEPVDAPLSGQSSGWSRKRKLKVAIGIVFATPVVLLIVIIAAMTIEYHQAKGRASAKIEATMTQIEIGDTVKEVQRIVKDRNAQLDELDHQSFEGRVPFGSTMNHSIYNQGWGTGFTCRGLLKIENFEVTEIGDVSCENWDHF